MQHNLVPISAKRDMTEEELTRAMKYSAHASSTKEMEFVWEDLAEQAQTDQISISPLWSIRHLPRLWIPPLADIPQ